MSERVNILEQWGDDEAGAPSQALELVRLDAHQTAVVPFTSDTEVVNLHYVDDREVRGYVHCNGPACALCRAGRGTDVRALLPVYVPATGTVAVLPVSPSARPGALRPQIFPALRAGRRAAFLIRKPDRVKYEVSVIDLAADVDDGAAVIKAFVARWEAGEVKLASVYPCLDNRTLAEIPGIATLLKIKGATLDEDGDPQ
jgi:hypothetical protein